MTDTNALPTLFRAETKGKGLTIRGLPVTFDRAVWFVKSRDFTPTVERTTDAEQEAFDESELDTFGWFLNKAMGWQIERIEVSAGDDPPSRMASYASVVGMLGPLAVPIFDADRLLEGSKEACDYLAVRAILFRFGDGALTRVNRRLFAR